MTNGTKREPTRGDAGRMVRMVEHASFCLPGVTGKVFESREDLFRAKFDAQILGPSVATGNFRGSNEPFSQGFYSHRAHVEPRDPTWQ